MTVDDALYHMELVGHDFYLFIDQETERAERRLPAQWLGLRRDRPRRRRRRAAGGRDGRGRDASAGRSRAAGGGRELTLVHPAGSHRRPDRVLPA